MKKQIITLVFSFVCALAHAQFVGYTPVIVDDSRSVTIPSIPRYNDLPPFVGYVPSETVVTGTKYEAVVIYKSQTEKENTYKLDVIVNKGSVNKIIFNKNGGCVHVGINNSGYKYYGGNLEYNEELDAYITQVQITYSNGYWQLFTVLIPA